MMSEDQCFIDNKLFPSSNNEDRTEHDYKTFDLLYDEYAPKAFGFIVRHTKNKEKAEEYLTNVFLRVWQEIKTLDEQAEKKFLKILLLTCKPIYKNKIL